MLATKEGRVAACGFGGVWGIRDVGIYVLCWINSSFYLGWGIGLIKIIYIRRKGFVIRKFRNSNELLESQNAKKFDAIEELEKWASEIWGAWEQQYIKDKDNSISVYCGEGAKHGINEYFRSGKQKFKEHSKTAEEILQVLNSAPRLPEDIITYRIVGNSELFKLLETGKVDDYGFISTTPLFNFNGDNIKDCDYFEIFVPKGTVCAYVEHLSVKQEHELLITANKYKVIYTGKKYKKQGATIYKCYLNK